MRNEAEYVRSFAIEAFGQVLKAAPQQAEQVPEGTFANQASSDGWTPLMSAAQEGRLKVAQFLVDKGADVNQATTDGRTPLHLAAQGHHNREVVECLQKAGASLEATDKEGKTPLMIAKEYGCSAVVHFLAQQGAQENQQDL